jgi:hypothetical protein
MNRINSTLISIALTAVASHAAAEIVNDFECTLNAGYTVPQLYAFQQEWMSEARKRGFDEKYQTRIYFPLYNDVTTTEPMFFIWRGEFSGGEQFGRMIDWFPTSEWAGKFAQVMNCAKSSLWIAPQ